MPPPSSGGIAIQQMLGILERRLAKSDRSFGLPWVRALLGAMRHSFADRAAYGGDPDFVSVPVDELLAVDSLDRQASRIPKFGPIDLNDAGLAGERGELAGLVVSDGGTSHLSVMDADGGAVALTTTINLSLGSLQADPQTGIVLNDEMDDFAARPGKPNAFGLVQSERNRPEARKRPLSSMSPTIVLDGEMRPVLALGAAGGPRIITATLQTLIARVDDGLALKEALARPRLHHQWLPETILVEPEFPTESLDRLKKEGFSFEALRYAGVVQATAFSADSGRWEAEADPRAGGSGAVWDPTVGRE